MTMAEIIESKFGGGYKQERKAEGEKEEFSLWEKPLTRQEIKECFWFIEEIRKVKNPEEKKYLIKKLLPNLLSWRLKEELIRDGKELFWDEEGEGEKKGIIQEKNYRWARERKNVGEEEEKLKFWQNIRAGKGGKQLVRFCLGAEELRVVIDKFLREIEEITEEELGQIKEEKEKIKVEHKKFRPH